MDFLNCTICEEQFNIQNKQPKLLNCGHNACLECLQSGIQNGCCQSFQVTAINKLPTNLFIMNFVGEDNEMWKAQDQLYQEKIKRSNQLEKRLHVLQSKLQDSIHNHDVHFQGVDIVLAQIQKQVSYSSQQISKMQQTRNSELSRNAIRLEQLELLSNALQETVETRNQQIASFIFQIQIMRQSLLKLEQDLQNQEIQNKENQNNLQLIANLQKQLQSSKMKTEQLETQKFHLQEEISNEKSSNDKLQNFLLQYQDENEKLSTTIQNLKIQIKEINQKLLTEQEKFQDLSVKENKIQASLKQKQNEMLQLESNFKATTEKESKTHQKEIENLKQQLSQSQEKNQQLQQESQDTQNTLQKENLKIQNDLQACRQQKKQLVETLKAQTETLEQAHKNEQVKVQELSLKEQHFQENLQQKEKQLLDTKQSIVEMTLVESNQEQEITSLRQQLTQQKSATEQDLEANQQLQRQIQNLQEYQKQIENQLEQTQHIKENQTLEIQDLQNQTEKLNKQIQLYQTQVENLTVQRDQSNNNLKEQENEIAHLKVSLQEQQNENNKLTLQNQTLEKDVQSQSALNESKSVTVSEQEYKIKELEQEALKDKETVQSQQNKIQELQELTKEIIKEEQATQKRLKESQKELENEKQMIKELQEQLIQSELQGKSYEMEKNKSEQAILDLNLQIYQLKEQMNEVEIKFEAKLTQLSHSNVELQSQLNKSQNQEKLLNSQIGQMKQFLDSSHKQESSLSTIRQLQMQINTLELEKSLCEEQTQNNQKYMDAKLQESMAYIQSLELKLKYNDTSNQELKAVLQKTIISQEKQDSLKSNVLMQSIEGITNEKAMVHSNIWKLLESMLDNKYKSDVQDFASGFKPKNMTNFLQELLLQQYGVKNLANKTLAQLLLGLNQLYKDGYQYGMLFCRILQVFHPDPADLPISVLLTKIRHEFIKIQDSRRFEPKKFKSNNQRQEDGGEISLVDAILLIQQYFKEDKQFLQTLCQSLLPSNSRAEFLGLLLAQKISKQESINQIFSSIDKNGTGSLTTEQMTFGLLNQGMIYDEVENFMTNFQKQHITSQEFANKIQQIQNNTAIHKDMWFCSRSQLLTVILDTYESKKRQDYGEIQNLFNEVAQNGVLNAQQIQELIGKENVESMSLQAFQYLTFYRNLHNCGIKALEGHAIIDALDKTEEVVSKKPPSRKGSLRKKK